MCGVLAMTGLPPPRTHESWWPRCGSVATFLPNQERGDVTALPLLQDDLAMIRRAQAGVGYMRVEERTFQECCRPCPLLAHRLQLRSFRRVETPKSSWFFLECRQSGQRFQNGLADAKSPRSISHRIVSRGFRRHPVVSFSSSRLRAGFEQKKLIEWMFVNIPRANATAEPFTAIYCMFGQISWQLLRPLDEDRPLLQQQQQQQQQQPQEQHQRKEQVQQKAQGDVGEVLNGKFV